MTSDERERRIEETMHLLGVSRDKAEFYLAIEAGEVDGDEEIVDAGDTTTPPDPETEPEPRDDS